MVSGLVTSPCDQLRIFSGDAKLMRIASKSVMVFPRSNGLERYKIASDRGHFAGLKSGSEAAPAFPLLPAPFCFGPPDAEQGPVACFLKLCGTGLAELRSATQFRAAGLRGSAGLHSQPRAAGPALIRGGSRHQLRRLLLGGLDQFHIKAERLQLADQHVERLRHTRLDGGFPLDDGLVDLGSAIYVVRLRREQFLQ